MLSRLASLVMVGILMTFGGAASAADKPTIVLVHGAFAGSDSWNGVVKKLTADGYHVIAAANPLRGVKSDAQYVSSLVAATKGSVVLVGHSYGGAVISNVEQPNLKALVYVAAFAPDVGDTISHLVGKFPGSTLGPALGEPVALANGQKDLYVDQAKFRNQFAADVPEAEASLMAVGQRPFAQSAIEEPSEKASWKSVPSWFIYSDADKNIPAQAIAWMAERAKSKQTVVVKGASHVVMVSHPKPVADLIEKAAQSISGN